MLQTKSNKFNEPRIFLLITLAIIIAVLLFYFVSSMFTSVGYQTFAQAGISSPTASPKPTIIIDAGHGGEDPGAVANGVIEKDANLSVALKLEAYLRLSGYEVFLTRSDDRLLYNDGEEERKKYFDLNNRLKIAEGIDNAIFVSVHMNQYPLEACNGLQTFYSINHNDSARLAQFVQEASKIIDADNQRQIKPDQGSIFLLKHLTMPAVLIECGFLSNKEEAKLLADNDYQNKLSLALCIGIEKYLEERQK